MLSLFLFLALRIYILVLAIIFHCFPRFDVDSMAETGRKFAVFFDFQALSLNMVMG